MIRRPRQWRRKSGILKSPEPVLSGSAVRPPGLLVTARSTRGMNDTAVI
jgi:hypothetical protein